LLKNIKINLWNLKQYCIQLPNIKQFNIMKKNISLIIAFVFCLFGFSTPRVISGNITASSDGQPIPGVSITIKGTTIGTVSDINGKYTIYVTVEKPTLVFSFIGMVTKEVKVGKSDIVNVKMIEDASMLQELEEVVVIGYAETKKRNLTGAVSVPNNNQQPNMAAPQMMQVRVAGVQVNRMRKIKGRVIFENENYTPEPTKFDKDNNNEEYNKLVENKFLDTKKDALSTFSIDVDRASYSNIRRMLTEGNLPNQDAVRIEEIINYFDYNYPQPTGNDPVTINTEVADSPWNKGLKLVQIGIQAKKIETDKLPASNLVFLIDVSGSMSDPNKLPLVKASLNLLIDQLRDKDKVAIVVYAGAAGLVLPSTSGTEKDKIRTALENLYAGGSTAGGEGIKLAYKIAVDNFIKNGNNRVIMASDGDLNVGITSEEDLKNLIEKKRETGVFLSVMGFGMGNYKDNRMEALANKGNGNYAYIDNILEAQKVFIHEFGGTMFTVAKDVKLQLEFNPNYVKAYRLIGYENRLLQNEDFNNDKKDAGEMGSGHTVTAFYEIIPVGVKSQYLKSIDNLKYQKTEKIIAETFNNEILTVKLRYKSPNENTSKLMEKVIDDKQKYFNTSSENFRFAAAVAEFGLILRNSDYKGEANYDQLIKLAKNAKGQDDEGYRAEFIKMVKTAQLLNEQKLAKE
jgi:Ca-activated chloride channel homolog